MGWKTSTIIVHQAPEVNHLELLNDLGYNNLKKIKDEPFDAVMNPDNNKVYIGRYKNNLIICEQDKPILFLDEGKSDFEEKLIQKFPHSEICVIILHSVVNLWGYAIIKDGQKIRGRAGNSDDGTFLEFGTPIEEELELFNKSEINEEGERIYHLYDDDEPFTEDQVGENFVFAITQKYLGVELDAAEEELYETMMEGYSFSQNPKNIPQKTTTQWRKWLPYLITILAVILWQILKRTVFNKPS